MTPTTALWIRLSRAARTVETAAETALKQAGLPALAWYDVLLELERAGPGGLRPVALQPRLLMPQYGLSRLLARIEAAGLIARTPCPDDARGHRVALTAKGRETRAAMWPPYREALETALGPLDRAETATLTRLLARIAPPA